MVSINKKSEVKLKSFYLDGLDSLGIFARLCNDNIYDCVGKANLIIIVMKVYLCNFFYFL